MNRIITLLGLLAATLDRIWGELKKYHRHQEDADLGALRQAILCPSHDVAASSSFEYY